MKSRADFVRLKNYRLPGYIKKKNNRLDDYSDYRFSCKEKILYGIQGILTVFFFTYFFYNAPVFSLLLFWLCPAVIKRKKGELCKKRKYMLCLQFKETVISISTNMQAGYSVENAIKNSLPDIRQLYGEKSDMVKELQALVKAIDNSVPVEEPILDLGRRSDVKHIQDFADIFIICKRNGGDMTEIMMNTVMIIGDSIDVEREIQTVISSKKLETKIMNIIPFAIVAYISITSPGFFSPLYGNAAGIIIMSLCLLLYLFSLYIEQRIMEIGV